MAYDPQIKMSIRDKNGNYYSAIQGTTGAWIVGAGPGRVYLNTLPDNWDKAQIVWERDNSYMGIFRSQGTVSYNFSQDGRAIIQQIARDKGLVGYGTLTVYQIKNDATGISYPVFYASQLDFKTYKDDYKNELLSIATLDNDLINAIHGWGDTRFNIPLWKDNGAGGWDLNSSEIIYHTGVKLLYNSIFLSGATDTAPLVYNASNNTDLNGFDDGNHGLAQGVHTIPAMSLYSEVQNNGATTFIGNTILSKLLPNKQQSPRNKEVSFHDPQERPYDNAPIQNLLPVSVDITFNLSIKFLPGSNIIWDSGGPSDKVLRFVLFPIDSNNNVSVGHYTYIDLYTIILPAGSAGTISAPAPIDVSPTVSLAPATSYIFGYVYDGDGGGGYYITAGTLNFKLSDLRFTITSKYDYGASGVPVPAPYLPPNACLGFRLHTLFEKIVPYLATKQCDPYGFPVPVTTDFTGVSTFLSDPASDAGGDCKPYQIIWTSAYAMHNISGQSFVTTSLNEVYDFCNHVLGCGAYVIGDTFYVDRLSNIFDSGTMILDLGEDITGVEISLQVEGVAASLKIGYEAADINSNYGVDAFCTDIFFNTPVQNITGTMDFQSTGVQVERYAAELIRGQVIPQPVGAIITPENPSRDNSNLAFYCDPITTTLTGIIRDPANHIYSPAVAYNVETYPNAQSTDPTAATAPYISGTYYPDTAVNLVLSPCRALQRDFGAYLHSVLDKMDEEYLTFRSTYVMQLDNTTLALPGIESNLRVATPGYSPIKEFADKLIGDLPPKLFLPDIIKVRSKYPINMYEILNTNPNGYVRCVSSDKRFGKKVWKFFIDKATYIAGTNEVTEFIGKLTPDMVF